jgi:hypothetical protein
MLALGFYLYNERQLKILLKMGIVLPRFVEAGERVPRAESSYQGRLYER